MKYHCKQCNAEINLRRHNGYGLCLPCYNLEYARKKRELRKKEPKPVISKTVKWICDDCEMECTFPDLPNPDGKKGMKKFERARDIAKEERCIK